MANLYFNKKFCGLEGGLFSSVTKADVGDNSVKLMEQGYELLGWADPFFPDHVMPASVQAAMEDCIKSGNPEHYTMPIGSPVLRRAAAEKCQRVNHLKVDPSRNVLVTPGSDSGLLFCMLPFLENGDEVLVPDPSYPSNFLNCRLCGAKAVPVPLDSEHDYQIDITSFESRLTLRTKMVVLTNPNNPTGTVFSKESIEALCKFCVIHDLLLVCDQAFEDHIYDGKVLYTPASFPGMWERTLTTFSLSKGYGLSGIRVGFIVTNDRFMDVLYGSAVNVIGATGTLSQAAALAALGDSSILPEYIRIFRSRRDLACSIFRDVPGISMKPSESGILSWMDVHELGTDTEVAEYLQEHAHVVVNEGHFYGEQGKGHIRFLHACHRDEEDARKVFTRMRDALVSMGQQ